MYVDALVGNLGRVHSFPWTRPLSMMSYVTAGRVHRNFGHVWVQ